MLKQPPAKKFEELIVWQKSHQLTLQVYRISAANIAERFKRRTNPDKARCMNIAQASLEEVRYYFILSRDLGYLKDTETERVDEVGRLLFAYIRTLGISGS